MTSPYPREPNIQSGGEQEPGGLVPPYEGRQTEGTSQEELAQKASERGHPGHSAGRRVISEAEREGLTDTDPNPSGPLGVGQSINKSGNERMYRRSEKAHHSDQVDTGVGGHQKNVDPESPTTIVGDQGG
jgi:hypothetical protein